MDVHNHNNCYCHLFWLLVVVVDGAAIDSLAHTDDTKSALVFFRWSGGFDKNFEAIRCATDQSSEDPLNRLVDVYPEMQDTIYFPRASDGSQRHRCESNSSIFVYNSQTRRVRLVGNRHCIVVNKDSYHYLATKDYPTVNVLKSAACERTADDDSSINNLIWSSEFRLFRNKIDNDKVSLRLISPTDGRDYTIYIRGDILIAVDKDDVARKVLDQLREPTLEIIGNVTHVY